MIQTDFSPLGSIPPVRGVSEHRIQKSRGVPFIHPFYSFTFLQFPVIGADIFIMAILHEKASGYHAELYEAQALIEMPCVDVGPYHGVELENPEAVSLSLDQAVQHQLFTVSAAGFSAYRVAGIADVAAAAHIIGMKNIEAEDLSALCVFGYARSMSVPRKMRRRTICPEALSAGRRRHPPRLHSRCGSWS